MLAIVTKPYRQRQLRKTLDVLVLGSGEEHGLALLRQQLHDGLHILFETNLQNTIGFIDDQALKILVVEPLRVLQVIQQAAGGRDQDGNSLHQLGSFGLAVGSTHDETVSEVVGGCQLGYHAKGLQSQLAGGGDDDCACALTLLPFQTRKEFDGREDKGKSLA